MNKWVWVLIIVVVLIVVGSLIYLLAGSGDGAQLSPGVGGTGFPSPPTIPVG